MATQLSCSIRRRSLKEPKNKERIFIILNDDDDEDDAVSISTPLPNIPNELIIEILSRLPVKSLVRFRCVSKSWNFLISNPQFVKKHMDMLIKHDTLDPFRLIIRYPFFDLKSCSLYSLYHEPFGYGVKLHFPWKDLDGFVRIWGSCNGLVCVAIQTYTSFNMFLWNPSTKESKLLPDLLIRKQLFDFVSFGFGYDCFGDDYKVVTIGCIDESTKVMVYSLRSNSWKMLDDIPYVIAYPEESGKLVNGTLSWIANRPLSSQTGILISFDIAGEMFEELPQPNYGVRHYTLYVRVLGDCLCMLCDRTLICVEVWIMNKYGIKDSWKKLVTIPYIPHMEPLYTSNGALCFSKYGGILMYFGDVLVLYDINEKTFKYPVIFGINGCHEAEIYMETLVSPNAYDGNGRDIFETSNIPWI